MPSVWFIRHAESEANAGLPTSGPVGIGLTSKGIKQAECVALSFVEQPSLIITSRYVRTKQTAQPTMQRFPAVHHEEWDVQEFTYLSCQRRSQTTTQDRRPLVDAYWDRYNPTYVDGKGAEAFVGFIGRVQSVLELLSYREESLIAVFTHEQFIHAVLWLALIGQFEICSETMKQFREFLTSFPMPNAAIVQTRLHSSQPSWFSGIVTSHLS